MTSQFFKGLELLVDRADRQEHNYALETLYTGYMLKEVFWKEPLFSGH
jgi:hypothetical protein